MLKVSNLTFGYNRQKTVIDGLSLEFNEGGIYGLLGKNGTGKSTLLYLIMGLLRPKQGEIFFDGENTKERNPEQMKEMFIVPEEYNLPSIKLPAYIKALKPFYPNFDSQLMVKLLELFEMTHANNCTMNAEGIPEINLGALSMGQKKKIYMCIALAARTKLLLMDEPTNGLDIPSKSQFRKVVAQGMRDDQTIIISTHQVRDVETLLDHVTMIEKNCVLVNQAIDMEQPVNLEEMFIKALTAKE